MKLVTESSDLEKSFKKRKNGNTSLTSYSPDGIKPWRTASKEKLVQKSMNTFSEIGKELAVSSTSHNNE